MPGWNHVRPASVLVVDDESDVRALISEALVREGHSVVECSEGRSALGLLVRGGVDLVVLDLGLPSLAGLDVLSELRLTSEVPVIILSGRGDESDRILGLKLGADDYLSKPFSPRELVARVESVLRRTRPASAGQRLEFPGLVVDTMIREVLVDGEAVEMTSKEFDVLAHLAASPRRAFSRAQLLRDVWASSPEWQQSTTVTEIVRRIRRKIEPDAENPRWIKTIRSVGYRFDPEP
ncbi:MAG: two-component system, OmpR family, response regulator ResD [Actinomycetota bacterium]|jgi:two-component system phosphate regulon response regulator PhoB|nr:two-component system, OmpR family, response regulator ResD [Actinomycetota bacterium]MDQ1502925.1 two-component system, OmpR family, response regulator ResD [Actinomycetota bacterium]